MSILVTGFQPFGKISVNPSQRIIEHLQAQQREDIVALVLPTEYKASGDCIQQAILEVQPTAILSLGVAQSRSTISLERVAINLDDASIPDNAGVYATGQQIAEDGPPAYWATLPLLAMHQALAARGIPVTMSNHAGTYICNHVFYVAQHTLAQSGKPIPCGFIHIPDIAKPNESESKGLPLEKMIEAVEICLEVIQKQSAILTKHS